MKSLNKNPDTQALMNDGIQKVADIVKCTLGPYGRNVAIMNTREDHSLPLLTDDGVRVVEFALNTLTELELLGAKLVYTSSKKTEEEVGDGTTSTFLLAAYIIDEYLKGHKAMPNAYINPVFVRRGLQMAKDKILEYLESVKIDTISEETLINIATSSSGSAEIGQTVGSLRYKLGTDGLVNIRLSRNNKDVTNYSTGYEFSGGFVNQDLFTNVPIDCYDPIVLVIDRMIMTTDEAVALISAYDAIIRKLDLTLETPMIVLANKIDGEALRTIYKNWFQRSDGRRVPIIPVEVPFTSDHNGTMLDLCTVTGAKLITSQSPKLEARDLVASFGRAMNIKTSKKMTHIVAQDSPEVLQAKQELVAALKERQLKLTSQETTGEYADLAVRISKLNGIAVTIEVGAQTDIERTERKLKYDDAVLATHAAIKDGIVIGGGYTLLKCYYWLKEQHPLDNLHPDVALGFTLLMNALRLPFRLIPENSGYTKSDILEQVDKFDHDWLSKNILSVNLDTLELETIQDYSVYDPYLVTKSVVENAVSAVSLFVSTENSVLVEFKQ